MANKFGIPPQVEAALRGRDIVCVYCYCRGAKQRPLPNAFGSADIFGRKVDAGFIQFIYFGQAEGGQAMIRRIDIDVLSTATTMSRTPGFTYGQAWSNGHAWGTFSGGAQVFGMSPVGCARFLRKTVVTYDEILIS